MCPPPRERERESDDVCVHIVSAYSDKKEKKNSVGEKKKSEMTKKNFNGRLKIRREASCSE